MRLDAAKIGYNPALTQGNTEVLIMLMVSLDPPLQVIASWEAVPLLPCYTCCLAAQSVAQIHR
jgi:hypothetical protein